LNTGVVALGELTLSVADVDLIYVGLQLVVTSIQSDRGAAPTISGPRLGPDSHPLPIPKEEEPPSQAPERPPNAALPLSFPSQAGSLTSGVPGEKVELIADAIADSKREHDGLGKLILTLMKVLHELLKRQALRRVEGASLSPAQVERLGVTLMNQAREIERLRKVFGLPEEDLNLDLGPLGKLL
jgi:hypothetical protein